MSNTGRIAQRKTEVSASTLPEVGKIKIGIKNEQKGYPMSLDYFRPTGNYANEFNNIYGDKPRKLTVAFISDDLNEVCNERYECWDKGKRWGWGDGNTFTVWDGQKYAENIATGDPLLQGKKWEIMLTLRFVLLDMKGIMGYWSFSTKAKQTTIPTVVKAFDYVRERANTIVGFPFNLIVEKKTGYNPGEARNYPVVSLVPNFSDESIEKVAQYLETGGNVAKLNARMIQAGELKQLAAGEGNKDA